MLSRRNTSDSQLCDTTALGWLDMPVGATARLGNLGE